MGDVVLKDGEDWTVTCKAWASRLVASSCQMGPGYELANEHGARELARRCGCVPRSLHRVLRGGLC